MLSHESPSLPKYQPARPVVVVVVVVVVAVVVGGAEVVATTADRVVLDAVVVAVVVVESTRQPVTLQQHKRFERFFEAAHVAVRFVLW